MSHDSILPTSGEVEQLIEVAAYEAMISTDKNAQNAVCEYLIEHNLGVELSHLLYIYYDNKGKVCIHPSLCLYFRLHEDHPLKQELFSKINKKTLTRLKKIQKHLMPTYLAALQEEMLEDEEAND